VRGGCTLLKGVHPRQTRMYKGRNANLGVGCGFFYFNSFRNDIRWARSGAKSLDKLIT